MAARNPEQELRKTRIISLFCLMETDLSGYSLKQMLASWNISEYLSLSPATIYRSLTKLHKDGYLSAQKVKQGNYPTSTIYSITDSGRELYRTLLEEEARFDRTSYQENTFIGLSSFLPYEERVRLTTQRIEEAGRLLVDLCKRLDTYKNQQGKPYAEWLLLDHEITMLQAQIKWLTRFLELVQCREA